MIIALVAGCGGGDGGGGSDAPTGDAPTGGAAIVDVPSLAEAMEVTLEDQRPDVRGVLGEPDAFRIALVPVEGGVVRHETWDYVELETRIDFVDGQIVLTADLEPVADGAWYPIHVDPSDFEAGMSPDDVRERLAGVELEELDLAEATGANGTALVGGQLFVTFTDGQLTSAESFMLAPDPDGLQAEVIEAVTP